MNLEKLKELEELLEQLKNSKPKYIITVNKDKTKADIKKLPSINNETIELFENQIKFFKETLECK